MKKFKHLKNELEKKPSEWKTLDRKKTRVISDSIGIFFYSIVCLASLVLAILYSEKLLYFYFFICISIFSSILILWWGGSKKDIKLQKGGGIFIKLIYWAGFLAVLFYLYMFVSSAYNLFVVSAISALSDIIKNIILFSGLALMFISLLTANLLYRKEVAEHIKERTRKLKEEIEEKLKQADKEKNKSQKVLEIKEEKNKEEEKEEIKMPVVTRKKGNEKTIETKLDDLFGLLEQNKSIKLSVIIKRFNITKEEALDWCSVLTEHGLAELTYPAFGEPELRLKR